jgi:glutamyl-Q tRNA(Asp) synthetase
MSSNRQAQRAVIGRFAPSPTGPLHFGSLVAALGSYLLARINQGQWLLRIEDLDPPRVVPGAAEEMIRLLEWLGFEWHGEILYQSRRSDYYCQVLQQLREQRQLFDCSCSRREVLLSAPYPGEEGPIYSGLCRQGPVGSRTERAIRLRVEDQTVAYRDQIFGPQQQRLQFEVGDFVLRRADGLFAYQLAVVADDIDSGVTQVVRGADLLASTPRQIYLYQCLQQPQPEYYHLPLALGADQEKLSKRHGAVGVVTVENGPLALWHALIFLGQPVPGSLRQAPAKQLLDWALSHFSVENISIYPQPAPLF